MDYFEDVLLLIRDFANPSGQDTAFPTFRNKDWYRGHSWASGFSADPMFSNIMNQESLSEAIASSESIALYGKVMESVYTDAGAADKASAASRIHKVGLVLTATEIRSTQKYWQIVHGSQDSKNVYPETYEHNVVGILWSTMIIFTTWFGNNPYLIYGIQLLPLTPISEFRDDLSWASEIYAPLAASCDQRCVSEGWSIQIFAILATIGHKAEAIDAALELSSSVYETAGGNGHSKSNTLWYISTRPSLQNPFPIDNVPSVEVPELTCNQPSTCTSDYLNSLAGEYSCRSRIEWLMNVQALSERDACSKIAVDEYPEKCSLCDPDGGAAYLGDDIDEGGDVGGTNDENSDVTAELEVELTCSQPANCTSLYLDSLAGEFSCRDRIQYLIDAYGQSEASACRQIAAVEFPQQCGKCNP
jgi:Glycosyl hydrolase family 81 C-terminal domain